MYIIRICAVYLILLFDISEFRYGCKHNFAVFAVWADSTSDYHIDWITKNYHLHGSRAPVDTETSTPVSELRNLDETSNNVLTTRINVDSSRSTISSGISSSVSATLTSIPFRASTITIAKSFTGELSGCKKKWTRACGIKKKNEKHRLKSSETVMTVILNTGIPLQEVGEKSEIDLPPTQTTEVTLQRSDINTQSSRSCDFDATTTEKRQDNDASSKPSTKTLQVDAENTADTTISRSQSRHNLLNADINYVTGPHDSATSDSFAAAQETPSAVTNAQTSPENSLAKKKKALPGKKKAQKCLPSIAQLKMIIKLENATAFYPGISEGSPFLRGDQIIIDDPTFRAMQTFFFLKLDESDGDTYANSLENSDEFQNIQCMVDGLTPDIVYTGWHRWQYSARPGTSQLICEANTIPSRYDTDYVGDIPTTHPLWYEPEQSVPGFDYLLSVQPSATGLYTCIAVDTNYNVLLTSYLDIRVKTVVRSTNASITPQSVQIYTNDTQASFIFNHCRGKIPPQTTETVLAATTVFFYSLDDSYAGNSTFAVNYLHTLPWRRAGWFFENLNLSSPMILQCKIAVSSNSDMSKSTLELYFVHESAKNRTYKAFTAIVNETLNFSCKQSFAKVPTQANASYFEGDCSDRNPSYINSEGSNITLTVNKHMCLICSSHSSQIKLQINTEDDYRTKLKVTRLTDQGNCLAILDMPIKHATVNKSSYCEEFAVTLSKKEHENQNRTVSFQPNTYKVYYTSRQFIVCQNQPVAWSIISKHKNKLTSNDDDTYVLKVVAGVFSAIIALLAFFVWMKVSKGKQQSQGEQLDSVHMHGSLAERQSNEKADASDEMDFANPREYIEPSKISIGPLIGSGKFGKVYKAYVKCKSLSSTDIALKVAVKELKAPFDNNTYNTGTVNKEIRVMRMIAPHLSVIKYYGYSLGVESNLLIMEMAEGPSLLEYLREQRIRVPGFALRLNYQSDYPDIKHALVGNKISISSSYSNVTYSQEFFDSRSNIEYPKDNSTNSVRSLCNENEILEIVDSQRGISQKFTDDISLSSMPDYDQWVSDYEDSSTEKCAVNHFKQCCSEWSRRTSSAIESMSKEIFSICRQVARGMSHISSLNIIHRDLAARNVVIASSAHPLIVKICDFGMAHKLAEGDIIYKEGSVGPRPFRWMSPEALNKGEFSVFSDIWSYGVVCWEVITLGSYPFGKMPNFAAAAKVAAGHNLPRPSNCEPEIYAILKSCWRAKPSERASFESLEVKWSGILEANSDYIELRDIELSDCE